jgi:ATP-dependent Clp protease ATP-binding subunit ClpA
MTLDRRSLSAGATRLLQDAELHAARRDHPRLGLHHYLLASLEAVGGLAERLVPGLDSRRCRLELERRLQLDDVGPPIDPNELWAAIQAAASATGLAVATDRDVLTVLFRRAGWAVPDPPASSTSVQEASQAPLETPPPPHHDPRRQLDVDELLPARSANARLPAARAGVMPLAPGPASTFRPRATRPTEMLETFGRDLTRQAQEGRLNPVVGREQETLAVVETLCRRTKRNPVLVGPAGTGKTAIVEGLAQRIVRGEVPAPLRDCRILSIQPSALIAGASLLGETEKRIQAVLSEARQDGIILFIDEVHSLVGSGGSIGSTDLASLLKPSLARGDFACIAATTDEEYRRFIEPDAALERRFQPIRVNELSSDATREVLESLRGLYREQRGMQIPDDVLNKVLSHAERYMRNRYFPDKAVDVLDQAVAAALTAPQP